MATAATEYAITKIGMFSTSKKRSKPLRTYGRRNQAPKSTDSEPPAKRQRSSPVQSPDRDTETIEKQCAPPEVPVTTTVPEQTKASPPKQSILSYFKKVEATVVKEIETRVTSDDKEDSDDDSSPARRQPTKRKPRVLRLRPIASNDDNVEVGVQRSTSSSPTSTKLSSPSLGKENGKSAAAKRKRNGAAPSVQTTLNISSQAAFSECKVCDCLYNPLFPDDVKYHQKRHASVLRAKKKQEALEL